ncbi:LOW QUALITY PROTEIN: hypothetical protein Cgig2_017390 [Carnegiea gigantea]|uniref:Uncharacterized protein n=1 Tax=Carnegiea gigantea TaxID=171969 RepID=A0A9Q1JGG1_9CARY|nr:LOW QUALITY PROTEIN: hypothetical protein Cgig2_017390 [Carnegiea gigantea]
MVNKDQHVDYGQIMNKGQERHMGSGNGECEILKKWKIRHRKADMIQGKLALWLNFDTSSFSLPLAHGRMTMIEHDVHMMIGLPKGPLKVVESKNKSNLSRELVSILNLGNSSGQNMIASLNCLGSPRREVSYLIPNTSLKGQGCKVATDLIITKSQLLVEVITELEELIPRACTPLKRVRKVTAISMSDALIRETPKKSKSKTRVLSQGSYESEGLRVSQEEKQTLPKGVILVDSETDIPIAEVQVLNLMWRMSL